MIDEFVFEVGGHMFRAAQLSGGWVGFHDFLLTDWFSRALLIE